MSDGLGEVVLGIVTAIFFIAIGVILMTALYPINQFMAIVGVALLIVVAIAIVVGFIFSKR